MRRNRGLWLGLAALLVAVALGYAGYDRSAGPELSLVSFTETGKHDDEPVGTRRVELWVAHRGGVIETLHTRTRGDGRLVEERYWSAGRPGTVAVRNWRLCQESEEPAPEPRYTTMRILLDDVFGPAEVPAVARRSAGGVTWDIDHGTYRLRLTDLGRPYPDRLVEIVDTEGQSGVRIEGGAVTSARTMPDWTRGTCRPSAAARSQR